MYNIELDSLCAHTIQLSNFMMYADLRRLQTSLMTALPAIRATLQSTYTTNHPIDHLN